MRIAAWLASAVAAAMLTLALMAVPAYADGDPASDVLLGESVFYPYSTPVSAGLQRALDAEVVTAGRAHFPIKIALIESPLDLGAVPDLFDKPQQYADFLDQEIGSPARQPLLVVMPNGYGVHGLSAVTASAVTSLGKPTGSQSNDLASAAVIAVEALAAAAGHPLSASQSWAKAGNGRGSTTFVPVALALAAITTAATLVVLRRREWSLPRHRLPVRREAEHAARSGSAAADMFVDASRGAVLAPRLVVGLLLIVGGVLWAAERGLSFYGLSPVSVGYDLDQPPLLLALVGGWLLYRSRGR